MNMTNKIQKLKSKSRLGQLTSGTRGGLASGVSGNTGIQASVPGASRIQASVPTNDQVVVQSNQTFSTFNLADDVVNNVKETVTSGLWSDNLGSLTTYFTASDQSTSQRRYYVDIYQDTPSADGAAVQFSLAYGNAVGSGSSNLGTQQTPASKAIYSQYRNLLLESTDTRFTTTDSGSTDSIYVVNIKRNRVKERLDEGNFELPLLTISSRATNATGSVSVSGTQITLIDDSSIASATVGSSGRVYNIVSDQLALEYIHQQLQFIMVNFIQITE